MFEQSSVTVKDVFDMVQAIYLRHQLTKVARHAMLEFSKMLAGPDFANLNISDYNMSKYYEVKDNKVYIFYCNKCKIPLGKAMKNCDIKKGTLKCIDCSKN